MRYYTALFVLTIVVGYLLWQRQMALGGYSRKQARSFALWGTFALLVGARLGHCLFYQPGHYLKHPLEILLFWKGGLSSHGAMISMAVALVLFARKHGMRVLDATDRLTFSAATGAILVRIGNFFNSEIVGIPTTLPIGVRFTRYDGGAQLRHPVQLYEAALGVLVLVLLFVADARMGTGKRERPAGVLTGLFLFSLGVGRFVVEFTKAHQAFPSESWLTMGQVLCVPMIFAGGMILYRTISRKHQKGPEKTVSTSFPLK